MDQIRHSDEFQNIFYLYFSDTIICIAYGSKKYQSEQIIYFIL